jgi:hypothetical protein
MWEQKDWSKDKPFFKKGISDTENESKPSKVTENYNLYTIDTPKGFDRKKYLEANVQNSPHKNHDEATENIRRAQYERNKRENPGNFRKTFGVGIEFDKNGKVI